MDRPDPAWGSRWAWMRPLSSPQAPLGPHSMAPSPQCGWSQPCTPNSPELLSGQPEPQPGDLLEFDRAGYKHWGVYVGEDEVRGWGAGPSGWHRGKQDRQGVGVAPARPGDLGGGCEGAMSQTPGFWAGAWGGTGLCVWCQMPGFGGQGRGPGGLGSVYVCACPSGTWLLCTWVRAQAPALLCSPPSPQPGLLDPFWRFLGFTRPKCVVHVASERWGGCWGPG